MASSSGTSRPDVEAKETKLPQESRSSDSLPRDKQPIPDRAQVGLTTYDAATVPMLFPADETTDLGSDSRVIAEVDLHPAHAAGDATPVTDDVEPGKTEFADTDHLITAEERLRVAMARQ